MLFAQLSAIFLTTALASLALLSRHPSPSMQAAYLVLLDICVGEAGVAAENQRRITDFCLMALKAMLCAPLPLLLNFLDTYPNLDG